MLRQLILDSCCYYLVDDLCDHNGETPIYRDLRTVELPERGDGEEDSVYWCKVLLQEGANPNAGINMPDGSVPSAAQARMLVDRGGVPNDDLIACCFPQRVKRLSAKTAATVGRCTRRRCVAA